VRYHEVAVGEDAPDVDVGVGERGREARDELDEGVEAVGRERVVLDVLGTTVELS
jgi:flagellar biosynthesis/type III secretory pathway ATPase